MDRPLKERRKQPRTAVSGKVDLVLRDPLPEKIEGELLDISRDGFRASHDHSGLRPGLEVHFHYQGEQGQARAMWTRVSSGNVETGFLVLRPSL